MLVLLHIKNYVLVENSEIEFGDGFTAISGETGAGKSLILDALTMAIGGRADTAFIRKGERRSEVTAHFDISKIPDAVNWLRIQDFQTDGTCVLRRLLTSEGRSRGYINGHSCTMQQLRQLGNILVDIHDQHEHQSLMRRSTHRRLLDEYAGATNLATRVKEIYSCLVDTQKQLEKLEEQSDQDFNRVELLRDQLNELEKLGLQIGEVEELESEQRKLSNAEQIIFDSRRLLSLCEHEENHNIRDSLLQALSLIDALPEKPNGLNNAEEMLRSSLIQVEEATREIETAIDRFIIDPKRLDEVNQRLTAIFHVARKHRVRPIELIQISEAIEQELNNLCANDDQLKELKFQLEEKKSQFHLAACDLSGKRAKASKIMAEEVNNQLNKLAMQGANIRVLLTPSEDPKGGSNGLENIEFVISTNAGQQHRPLHKIVSGGELSRISLAIQVVAAENSSIPTLIFDEVDVGVGGATADTVGQLLKTLGLHGQVVSVTHQAQVAAHADLHYLAKKVVASEVTASIIEALDTRQRTEELARMLGASKITNQSRVLASELLTLAQAD